jgi:hypothetical protein
MFGGTGDDGGTLTLRARTLAVALAVCVSGLAEMCLLAVFDEFKPPAVVQWALSLSTFAVLLWRFLRVGVKVSPHGLTLLNPGRDVAVPWQRVVAVTVGSGGGSLGHTEVPVVEVEGEEGGLEATWLAGYTFRGANRRVIRQTEMIKQYWLEHRDG